MQRFEASLRARVFWPALIVPPVAFWGTVQFLDQRAGAGAMSIPEVFLLIGLAQFLPLAALGWILTSVCGYTIEAGRIVIHRVLGDREVLIGRTTKPPRLLRGAVVLRLPGRVFRLRVTEPERCLAALSAQLGSGQRED